jgi:hypothetical protein
MVQIFRTNIQEVDDAYEIIQKLLEQFPTYLINFDLEDCDNILRVKGKDISLEKIISVLHNNGYQCDVLD